MRKSILIFGHDAKPQFIDIFNQYTRVFDKNLYEITVIYLTGQENALVRQQTLAEQVIFLEVDKKALRGLKISVLKKLAALLTQKSYAAIICHRYKPIYLMSLLSLRFCIPQLILVMHELGTFSSWRRKLLFSLIGRRKNIVFAGVSNAVRDDMRKDLWFIKKERIITLYNMMDIELTLPRLLSKDSARALLNLPPEEFIFGHAARLVKNKDQHTLIAAFHQLILQGVKAKLVILGGGQLESELKKQIKTLNLGKHVQLMGFVPESYKYMRAFDCFVLPSIQEAFGRVLLEAFAAKVPVIATRVHGIPEVIADAGTLVPPKDQSALSEAMFYHATLSPESTLALTQKAYQRLTEHFSIPAFAKIYWQHFG